MEQLTKLEILLNSKQPSFSKNERKIADFFISHEENIQTLSVPEIAKACSVSQASVVRFCKTLGFSGMKEFKIFYQAGKIDVKKYSGPVLWDDSNETVFYKVFTSAITALQETFNLLDWKKFSTVAEKISEAFNIDVFGAGGSAVVASYFASEFVRLGMRVNAHTDIYTLRHFTQEFRINDIALFVSRSGENFIELAERAKKCGCTVIVITCTPNSPLTQIADNSIVTSEFPFMVNDNHSYSRIAEMTVITALYLMCALYLGNSSGNFKTNYYSTTRYVKL